MTLRRKLLWYLISLHTLILGAGITLLILYEAKPFILVLEVLIAISLVIGIVLTRKFNLHLELVAVGSEFIREHDFTHTFAEVESADLNKLVLLYNEMIRRLREEGLRNQEQQIFLEKVVDASPTGILTLDLDGRVELINPAAATMFGLGPDKLQGKRIRDLKSSFTQGIVALEPDTTATLTLPGRRSIKCIHSQYFDKGFRQSFYLLIEVTDELWMSEKAAYEILIRTLSHEVNNTVCATNSILRSCLTYANQLTTEDRADYEGALDVAMERNDNLNKFMSSYASVIRLPDPVKEWVELRSLLERITQLVTSQCEDRGIEFRLIMDDSKKRVELDVAQIEQVLMNLIQNAIEAIVNDGLITLTQTQENGHTEIILEDSGPGLSYIAKENLFTPFFSTKETGQGIGLTLVREILTRHSFLFQFDSEPPKATCFTIWMD